MYYTGCLICNKIKGDIATDEPVVAWAEGVEVSGKDQKEVERYVKKFKCADRKRKSKMKIERVWKGVRGSCTMQ